MASVRGHVLLFSFFCVFECRLGEDRHSLHSVTGLTNASNSDLSVDSTTLSVQASCSFSGPSWDPLLNCFNARDPVDDVIRYHLLCKLKKELAFETQAAWSNANSFIAIQPYNRSASSQHSFLQARAIRKCAVVSNSGVLRRQDHGSAIDKADFVFRFNDAPLSGWEKYVGTKESIRLVNDQFPKRVMKRTMANYDFQSKISYGILHHGSVPSLSRLRHRYPSTSIQLLSPALLKSVEKTLRSIYDPSWFEADGYSFSPTTGAVGILSAMARCDEVIAYGMAATPAAGNSPYHYYKEDDAYYKRSLQKADENTWHKSFKAEKDLWRRIARNSPGEIDNTEIAIIPGFSQIKCD